MKNAGFVILAVIIVGCSSYNAYLTYQSYELANSAKYGVLIAYNKAYLERYGYLLEAYKSVLTEEGVPWEAVEISALAGTSARKLAKTKPAIIFPDGLLQSMPEGMQSWSEEYLVNGGNLAIIYDPGVKTPKGYFREQGLLADVAGVNYITFEKLGEKAYGVGCLKFNSERDSDFCQIPPGKISGQILLTGYIYGQLSYPVARNDQLRTIPEKNILAYAVTPQGDKYPAVVLHQYGNGNVFYVNLPLGYLKAYSDDLPLRALMRTFLFQIAGIPHLVNANHGKGGLVINWHIDSSVEWAEIPDAIRDGILNKNLHYSIHITAGDFRDKQGDGLGFDAYGKGRHSAELFLRFGTIGSHGGWAHNWFSNNLEKENLSDSDMELCINKNRTCLEEITGYRQLEYSAPNGIHPQPITTQLLEKLGFNSYYYTGDSGSAPNRTFYDGKMVSPHVVAFPVLPLGSSASLFEMKKNGFTEKEVQQWLFDVVDYTIQHRVTRLLYSHLHDVNNYPQAMRNFLKYIEKKQAEGKLQVESMSTFTKFFYKCLETEVSCRLEGNSLIFSLRNRTGLKGVTVAIPRHGYERIVQTDLICAEDDNYYYLTVNEDVKEKSIRVNHN